MLKFADTVEMSIRGLVQHKLRTLLSTLGIIFGVAAVISIISVGEGARREAIAQIKLMGVNNIRIRGVAPTGSALEKAGYRYERGLTTDDVAALREGIPAPLVLAAPLKFIAADVRYGARRGLANIVGTTPEHEEITNFRVSAGRFITPLDLADNKAVCVLGADIKRELFGLGDAIAARLRIGDTWFAVVGVMEPKELYKGKTPILKLRDINRDIYLPVAAALGRFPGDRDPLGIDEIAIRVADERHLHDVARLARAILARRHRGVEDYEIMIPEELLAQARETQRLFNIVVGAIAGISLIVGGIGIMNIMLANVSERRREIGVRRAIGARQRDILIQFLIETVLVCLAGGFIGIFLGFAMGWIISFYAQWETALSLLGVAVAFGTSVGVGIVFGLFPARRAAQLDPVQALRS
jgi:putative ABC transport system permease protein